MNKIASGIFMWNSVERRSGRYGFVFLTKANYDETVKVEPTFDEAMVNSLVGNKKVKLYAVVTESRPSGHSGDQFLKIAPSQPEVGERVELGVGMLCMIPNDGYDKDMMIGLEPSDGRTLFWFDPRKLYRLHDQTVELFAEETDEPFSPAPDIDIPDKEANGMISLGKGEVQVCHYGRVGNLSKVKISPKLTRLGAEHGFDKDDCCFIMENPSMKAGETIQGSFEVQ